ncbi:MAG TPA: type 4a pilus biogenesis protein PilO [Vicinamibacterales bacterium]|nr:type 4a pilus biogenesis protein PilO [Vicinamibacterales bacterium]
MQLSLSRLPWYAQIGAFVVVCSGAVFGFWKFYVVELQADIAIRQTRLRALRADVAKGVATARRLPQFQAEVDALENRLESLRSVLPEEKDVADILRRIQGLATQSSLSIQRFTPQPSVQQALYAEVPFRIQAEGTYHNLGRFFDSIGKFPRIINVSDISIRSKDSPDPNVTIVAECTATTFVLQEGAIPKKGAKVVPKQPAAAKPPAK